MKTDVVQTLTEHLRSATPSKPMAASNIWLARDLQHLLGYDRVAQFHGGRRQGQDRL